MLRQRTAASDFVLTPITPSVKSIVGLVPLLGKLQEVQGSVNKDLQPLGVVINGHQDRDLTPREHDPLPPNSSLRHSYSLPSNFSSSVRANPRLTRPDRRQRTSTSSESRSRTKSVSPAGSSLA